MLWSFLFAIGIAQGCFLILVFSLRKNTNLIAARLLQSLLAIFVLSNFDDLLLSTNWFKAAPWLFGWSFPALFTYGPLFFLYLLSISQPDFQWQRRHWLHFLPAGVYLLICLPFILLNPSIKIGLLEKYLSGQSPVQAFGIINLSVQVLHLFVYLYLSLRQVRQLRKHGPLARPATPNWTTWLMAAFSMILAAVVVMGVTDVWQGVHSPGATFVFTLFTTTTGYFIAYKLMLDPAALTPGFPKKHQAQQGDDALDATLLGKLEHSMASEKIFTNPDIKLASVANHLGVPPHRLSGLINQRHGMTFSEFIAQRRVEEFIARLDDARFSHLSLYGLALEVGFNSKSAFNAAFKKVTGKNPSDFRH